MREEDVRAIRQLLAVGVPQKEIAKTFGLDQSAISDIKTGASWSWLDTSG